MEYVTIKNHNKGTVFDLLYQAFKPLMNPELEDNLIQYDTEIFDNPETVGPLFF